MRTAVLGAGAWGTALARLLVDAGHETVLWGRDAVSMNQIAARRENARYLPGCRLPDALGLTSSLEEAVTGRPLVVLAVPSVSLRALAVAAAPALSSEVVLVCASKGLEEASGLTLDQVLAGACPGARVALLSGPTFAAELARGLPAAAVIASTDPEAATFAQRAFNADHLRVYTTPDVTGVAIGGALKNVVAIAAGCSDGLGFGHNARAGLITRGLHEMGRLVARLGGDPMTLAGLAGLGDLILTCTGELSRNRQVGLALAAGEPVSSVTARLGHVAEGVYTARIAAALAQRLDVEMPITKSVAALVDRRYTPREAVADLLAREARPERG